MCFVFVSLVCSLSNRVLGKMKFYASMKILWWYEISRIWVYYLKWQRSGSLFAKYTIIIFNNYLDLRCICLQRIYFYIQIHDIFNRDKNNKMSIAKVFPIQKKPQKTNKQKEEVLVIILRMMEQKIQKKIKRRVFRKPMLETSLLQVSTIQAVVIFYLTA